MAFLRCVVCEAIEGEEHRPGCLYARSPFADSAAARATTYTALDYQEGLGRLAGAIQYLARRRRLDDGIVAVGMYSSRAILELAYERTEQAAFPWNVRVQTIDSARLILDSARRDH